MKRKRMVVDDDSNKISLIRDKLKKLNDEYKIISADNNGVCINLLHDNDIPDLILLDVFNKKKRRRKTRNGLQEGVWERRLSSTPPIIKSVRSSKVWR
jgi:CheY-like chemotaxis protein